MPHLAPFDGKVFGRYQILEILGQGGIGTVYRAFDPVISREIALKVIPLHGDAGTTARMLREVKVVGNLSHPNIVRLFDAGVNEDQFFLVQELLLGWSLDALVKSQEGPLPARSVVEILIQVAEALSSAHANGIVHRDVKPSNVIVSQEGLVKLLDFGIARLMDHEEGTLLTQTGFFLGTIAYSAPEQFMGTDIDHRADIFSFGALGYELLTGNRLFAGSSMLEVLGKMVREKSSAFTELDVSAPASVVTLLSHCVERSPDDRPQQMNEVIQVLKQAISGLGDAEDLKSWLAHQPISRGERTTTITPSVEATVELAATAQRPLYLAPSLGVDSTISEAAASVPAFPHRIRRFTLHELIAPGRSGSLYKAYDPVRGGLVGLKVVPIADERAGERLLRGGRIWLGLTHPNLLRVLEIHPAETSAPAVIVTEFVDGVDLASLMRERSLTLEAKLEIAVQVAEALSYLHGQGFIHREVKPRNVLVSRGPHALLLDSGIARSANPDLEALTRVGTVVGDLRYMAPEQVLGMAEVRSDIFSLGALIYELLVGEQPMLDDRTELFARLHADRGLPQRLTEVVEKCLAERPGERYGSANDVAESLRGLMAGAAPRVRRQRQVVALHGIRTYARWQRAFAEVADEASWNCRSDRWNFGYFSIFRFLQPWSRSGKVEWFRRTYREEFSLGVDTGAELPSIVAHSFGTYILGNALLRYPYLRFNKVILCGSILPTDFPWATLLDTGQVQSVRNEYGASDFWTGLVEHFVAGTGASGRGGFEIRHRRLEQERFDFTHSEYFERSHMEGRWIPFLSRTEAFVAPRERSRPVE